MIYTLEHERIPEETIPDRLSRLMRLYDNLTIAHELAGEQYTLVNTACINAKNQMKKYEISKESTYKEIIEIMQNYDWDTGKMKD